MTGFWWGVLAFPALLVALGLIALLVFGSWLALERWAEHRWRVMKPKISTAPHGEVYMADDGGRGNSAARVALAPVHFEFRLGFGWQLGITGKTQRIDRKVALRLENQVRGFLNEHYYVEPVESPEGTRK